MGKSQNAMSSFHDMHSKCQVISLALTNSIALFRPADHKILRERTSVSFVLRVCHHEVVCNNQDKDEDPQEIGKEAQVLIVKHLKLRLQTDFGYQ